MPEDSLSVPDATADGLTAGQAAERLDAAGPNTIEAPITLVRRIAARLHRPPSLHPPASRWSLALHRRVARARAAARTSSTVIVIGTMLLLVSGGMKFIQEARSGNAAEAPKDLVSNTPLCAT